MDKITQFKKIKGHKIFKDFAWSSSMEDFSEKNVIYGWNGSGKTTLSNIFRAMEKKQNITEGEVTITIGNTSISGSTFVSSQLPKIRVFNRDFVEKTVFKVNPQDGNSSVTPIYILGEESADKQDYIKKAKNLIQRLEVKQQEISNNRDRNKASADNLATDTAKAIKDFIQLDDYRNYNKTKFESCFDIAVPIIIEPF